MQRVVIFSVATVCYAFERSVTLTLCFWRPCLPSALPRRVDGDLWPATGTATVGPDPAYQWRAHSSSVLSIAAARHESQLVSADGRTLPAGDGSGSDGAVFVTCAADGVVRIWSCLPARLGSNCQAPRLVCSAVAAAAGPGCAEQTDSAAAADRTKVWSQLWSGEWSSCWGHP